MALTCAVPGCSSVKSEDSSKLFFAAPQQESVRRHWFEVLSMPYKNDEPVYICVDHFEVEGDDENDVTAQTPSQSNGAPSFQKKSDETAKPKKRKHMAISSPKEAKKPYLDSIYDEPMDISRVKIEPTIDIESSGEDSGSWNESVIKEELGENTSGSVDYVRSYISNLIGRPLRVQDNTTFQTGARKPYLKFIEQPEQLFRFRYQRESNRPHGPLKGRASNGERPSKYDGPKVQLFGYTGTATLRCWLFSGDWPSPHLLVSTARNGDTAITYEPLDSVVGEDTGYTAMFDRLNILHVVCGAVDYQDRYLQKIVHSLSNQYLPPEDFPIVDHNSMKDLLRRQEKDIVCLFVEAFAKTKNGYRKLCHVFSDNIKNRKSPKTNNLQILKQSHDAGPCCGRQRIFIFTSKIIKSVAVEFYEKNGKGQIIWRKLATMSAADVHKQVALSFLTPPYKNPLITSAVTVDFRLIRRTDGAISNSRKYSYWPCSSQGCVACSPHLLKSTAHK